MRKLILAMALFLATVSGARAERYTKREVMIPMRDGVSLYTAIYEPEYSHDCPIVIKRTPFSLSPYYGGGEEDLPYGMKNFKKRGYIIVYQNVRGVYLSEGDFVNVRPLNPRATHGKPPRGGALSETDEATDAYDTIDWLLENTSNNGRVGVFGVSYPGFYATMAALSGHPSLKAVSPQAPVTDWWIGDDTHRNGAFMLADMYGFGGFFFQDKGNPTAEDKPSLVTVEGDVYDYFLSKGPLSETLAPLKGLGFMREIMSHPDYDGFWKGLRATEAIAKVRPAMLVVGGLYDAEDCYGAAATFGAIRRKSPKTEAFYVTGPWTHGGWRDEDFFLDEVEYPFFAHYLEGKGESPLWSRLYLTTGSERVPIRADSGTERAGKPVRYPIAGGTFVSDPKAPVPYMGDIGPYKVDGAEPISWRNKEYMWADQSFLNSRKDLLTCKLADITANTLLRGEVRVHIDFTLSTTDADFVVKLIDKAPDGTMSLVRGDVFPARYRKSLSKPSAVRPGRKESLEFTLNEIAHVFGAGHSIVVQIQGSWFPLVAMSPQKFLENQYEARAEDYQSATVTVLGSSWIELPAPQEIPE